MRSSATSLGYLLPILCVLLVGRPGWAQAPFTLGGVTAQPGTTVSGTLEVRADAADQGATIPFSIVHGAKAGPVLALTAGVHGFEYPPILALQRLRTAIDPQTLSGTIIMVHVVNMPSFLGRTVYYSPVDGKNLNRVFPGRPDGTLSERIAHTVTTEIIDRATHLIDLHCGDGNESLRPYLYLSTTGDSTLVEATRQMALAFGFDHIVLRPGPSSERPGGLSSTAYVRGKPALTIESGQLGETDEQWVGLIERGVAGVLRQLKMRPDGPAPVGHVVWIEPNQVLTSGSTGIFYPTVVRGHTVAKDALLGYITDFHGRRLEEIRAPFSGEVIWLVGVPAINKGDPLGMVGQAKQ